MGDGLTIETPWTLSQALASGRVHPGDIIKLRGGVYAGDFARSDFPNNLNGFRGKPIVIQPYGNEKPIIDGSIEIGGQNVVFRDIEFRCTMWQSRQSANSDPSSGILNGMGVNQHSPIGITTGENITFINCIIHDGFNVGAWNRGLRMYGCLIYNNGVRGADGSGNGHGLYTHPDNYPDYPAILDSNIFMANYNYTLHLNSDDNTNKVTNYIAKNNIIGKTNGKNIFGCGAGLSKGLKWQKNCTWSTFIWFNRWSETIGEDIEITDNYFVGGNSVWNGAASIKVFRNIVNRRNTWVSYLTPEIIALKYPIDGDVAYDWDDNDYYTDGGLAFQPYNQPQFDNAYHTFADWQTLTGLDINSQEHLGSPPDQIFLYPNQHDAGRTNLAVYNWSESDDVIVDVSSVYRPDEIVRVHNAQDYYNDYEDLIVDATGKITISMRLDAHSVAIPYADNAPLDSSSFPVFGAFMLERL